MPRRSATARSVKPDSVDSRGGLGLVFGLAKQLPERLPILNASGYNRVLGQDGTESLAVLDKPYLSGAGRLAHPAKDVSTYERADWLKQLPTNRPILEHRHRSQCYVWVKISDYRPRELQSLGIW